MRAKKVSNVSGGRVEATRAGCSKASCNVAHRNKAVQIAYTKVGLTAYRIPPIAGPEMVATCVVTEEAATARGSISAGATAGRSGWLVVALKARPAARQNPAETMNFVLIPPV